MAAEGDSQPEGAASRYGPLWRPPGLREAMRSIFSDDPEYFDSSGQETARFITTLIPSPDAVVVDLGCGIGRVAKHVAPGCGLLWAADVSPEMLALAAEWLDGVANVRLSLCEDERVPDVPDESADLVYSIFVLQHVEREDAFLLMREVHRMLRPGGCAFLSFPNLEADVYLKSFIAYAESGEASANPARARMYVPDEVRRLVLAAGLVIVEMDDGDHINVLAMRRRDESVAPAPAAAGDESLAPAPAAAGDESAPGGGGTAGDEGVAGDNDTTRDSTPEEVDGADPLRSLGGIDTLAEGTLSPAGPLRVTGWVALEGAPVDRLEVEADGCPTVQARLGLVRDDALAATGYSHAQLGGFEAWVDLTGVSTASVAIRARAYPLGGEPIVLGEIVINLAPADDNEERRRRERRDQLAGRWEKVRTGATSGIRGDLSLAVFAHDLRGGGAQAWLWEPLSRSGAGRSFPCTVIAPAPGPQAAAFEALGIAVHITRPCPVWDIELYEGAVAELGAFVATGGYTAVLVNTFVPFLGADMAARLGLPCVWALHESYDPVLILPVLYAPAGIDPLVQEAAMRSLGEATRTVFVSEATRALFLDVVEPTRALVVPYGVDTAAIEGRRLSVPQTTIRRDLGLPAHATVVLSVGVTEPRKGQTTTALAFARLAQDHPDVVLAFVGAVPGLYAEGLRRFLREAALEERSRVVPFTAETSPWYLAADVVVSAGDIESLPRSMLEAMAYGVPVLASSVFGVPEVIEDGRNGWLFEPGHVSTTEEALRRVLSYDGATRRAVGAAGQATVRQAFDVNGYVTALPDMLRRLVSERAFGT